MGLAGPVGAEHRHPFAVPDLEVERLHQVGQLEVGAHDRALARAPTLEPHLHLLLARLLGGRPGVLELLQPGLGRLVAAGHVGVVGRLLLVHQHLRAQLGVLLVPAAAQLLEALEPLGARLVVAREAAGVGPHQVARAAELDGHDPGGGVVEQLAVVADEQDRLGRLADPLLEPDLAGHVEVVVRLVEQQHLVGALQQVLQHEPLLLAARQRGERAVAGAVVGHPHRGGGDLVPDHLEVVAADVAVVPQRLGVRHLHRLAVVVHQPQLLGRRPPRTTGARRPAPPTAAGRRPSRRLHRGRRTAASRPARPSGSRRLRAA